MLILAICLMILCGRQAYLLYKAKPVDWRAWSNTGTWALATIFALILTVRFLF